MEPDCVVLHYGEIALKGGNRPMFEDALVRNLRRALRGLPAGAPRRYYGRIVVPVEPGGAAGVVEASGRVFGVATRMAAVGVEADLDEIARAGVELVKDRVSPNPGYSRGDLPPHSPSFAVDTRRSDKGFPLTSQEVSQRVGRAVVEALGLRVDLDHPGVTLHIEVTDRGAYLSTEKARGPGGLPVGTAGRVLALLSGGLDSPVAAWMAMKRGCRVGLVHFQNEALERDRGKIVRLAAILDGWQGETVLRVVPFAGAQRAIVAGVPSKYRMIVYRRFMARIAERLAARDRAPALVTGDSLSQVASQTLENLTVIEEAVHLPVLKPLLGFDKEETVEAARRLGTYPVSIEPYGDCCSYLVAKHPATRSTVKEIRGFEEGLDVEGLVASGVEAAETVGVP